jgi:hypothetical protein
MLTNTEQKERECVRVVANGIAQRIRLDMKPLSKKITAHFSNYFGAGAIGVLIYLFVQLPLALLLSPIWMPWIIRQHSVELHKIREIELLHLNYSPPEIRHIGNLWEKYGLRNSFDENQLALVLSSWLEILHDEKFHLSPEEIIRAFKLQEKRQAAKYNECFEKKGIRLNSKNWRHVAISNIMNALPNYA